MVSVTVGLLLALAVLAAAGAPQRGGGPLRPASAGRRVRDATHPLLTGVVARWRHRRDGSDADTGHVQVVMTQVAGLVRSGMPPERAWASVDVATDPDGAPRAGDLSLLTRDPAQVQAVVAACRLAHEVGAPIAPVLDSIVATLVVASEAAAERTTALAGPQSTARLLLWLPAVGACLATALGAGPVEVLLRGGPVALAPVAGTVMLLLGRWWTRRLVRAAVSGPVTAGRSGS